MLDKGYVAEILDAARNKWRRMTPKKFASFVADDIKSGAGLEAREAAAYYFDNPDERNAAIAAIDDIARSITS